MQTAFYKNNYGGYNVYLKKESYMNGRVAIQAFEEGHCPAFHATVNLPDIAIGDDEAFIKDYAENEGVLSFLKGLGIVTEVVRYVVSGWVMIPLCKIDMQRLNALV